MLTSIVSDVSNVAMATLASWSALPLIAARPKASVISERVKAVGI